MNILVTSAAGANGNGHDALLALGSSGKLLGRFSEDVRIADPRGMAVDDDSGLLFLNSGDNRILALDGNGNIVRDTGPIGGLNPGGGTFGPDRRYYVGSRGTRTILAFGRRLRTAGENFLAPNIVPFPRGFAKRATIQSSRSGQAEIHYRLGWCWIPNSVRWISWLSPTATFSFPASTRSVRLMRSRPSGNTKQATGISFACSDRAFEPGFAVLAGALRA
jgi:hypothetical protein